MSEWVAGVMETQQRQDSRLDLARDLFLDILRRKDFEMIEAGSALLKACLGMFLMLPLSTFSSSPGFAAMTYTFAWQGLVSPEGIWGALLVSAGLAHLWSMIEDNLVHRRRGAAVGAFVWLAIAFMVGKSNPAGLGWLTFGFLFLFQAVVFWRLGRRMRGL